MSPKGTALITGGARRIGRAVALALSRNGYDIAIHYNSSEEDTNELRKQITDEGRKCSLFKKDLNKKESSLALIEDVFNKSPDCSILVNSASIFERVSFAETTDDVFDRHFNINFRAPFVLSREFALRCKRGNIVNIIDTKVTTQLISYFAYSLTKKGLLDLTKMAAKALAPSIRVNAVCPGIILAPAGTKNPDQYLEKRSEGIPMKRKGTPEDVAAAVMFLTENEFITGECIFVDGGEHLT